MGRVQADIQSVISKRELFEILEGKTIFITGATGLIGSMLVRTIYAADQKYGLGLRIIGQVRNQKKAAEIFGNLLSSIQLVDNYGAACDYMIHTVSPTTSKFFIEHPVETIRTSVESTISVLETAKKNYASVVYLSSMEEYGVPYQPGEVMTEDKIGVIDHLDIRSSYSESKRLCECLCASYASEYGVDVKIARLAQTVGAGFSAADNRMPIQFARAVVEGKDIVLHTEGMSVSNFVYLTDAITGIMTLLMDGARGEAYNICNDQETRSVKEIAKLVSKRTAGGTIGVRIEIPEERMGYAPDNTMYLNADKLRNLGWNAEVGLEEAYQRLVVYMRGE